MYRYEYLLLHIVRLVQARPEPPKGYLLIIISYQSCCSGREISRLKFLAFLPIREEFHSFYSYREEHSYQ